MAADNKTPNPNAVKFSEAMGAIEKETILKIIDLRKKGFLLREICDFTKLSYPTVLKYAKEAI